ncbi:MAG TPA: hypothetical protein VJ694_01225 [Patescibacteria group bacterium]|nr:hypothetical protein [Patescibacteria group bacterium]
MDAFNRRSGVDLKFHVAATVRRDRIERDDGTARTRHASDEWREVAEHAFAKREGGRETVIVDVSDARTFVLHRMLVDGGFTVVTANKRPLVGSTDGFNLLTRAIDRRGHRSYWFEATVGGGLPVIRTLRELVETGDRIVRVTATLSGTLNFLCEARAKGEPFGKALVEARDLGLTEPDPREDLLCKDVIRKTQILANLCGCWWIPEDAIAPVISSDAAHLFGEDFVEKVKDVAEWPEAWAHHRSPEYVVEIEPTISGSSVVRGGLRERDAARSPLEGPENRFIIETERNGPHPIVIRGPGAGAAVTATAVFGDLLRSLARL